MRLRNVLLTTGAIGLVTRIAVTRAHSPGRGHRHHSIKDHHDRCGRRSRFEGSQWQGLTEAEAREKLSHLVGDGDS